jgi:hypothetical protein
MGFDSPRQIVNRVLRGSDSSVVVSIGSFESLYRKLRRFKADVRNPKPYLYEELKISENLSITCLGQPFFRYGVGNYGNFEAFDDFLILYSDVLLQKLNENSVWTVDGTFSVVPKPYYQLYSIGFIRETHVFPVIFGILKNKTKETYSNFLNIVRQLTNFNDPLFIKTDFEHASILALKEQLPNTNVSGCMFHLGQSINRKIQKLGLQCLYTTDNTIKKFVKYLTALSFVQPIHVRDTFHEIRTHRDFPVVLITVYDFFYDNYIGFDDNVRFPLSIWNFGSVLNIDLPRTNNGIEGWHSVFKQTFGTSRYSLQLLFEKLKFEEDAIRLKVLRVENNEVLVKNEKYVRMEDNLQSFLNGVGVENFGFSFVESLACYLFYD